MRKLVSLLWNEWKGLEQQIVAMNLEVERIASSDQPASGSRSFLASAR